MMSGFFSNEYLQNAKQLLQEMNPTNLEISKKWLTGRLDDWLTEPWYHNRAENYVYRPI
jgi:hypothetical protein